MFNIAIVILILYGASLSNTTPIDKQHYPLTQNKSYTRKQMCSSLPQTKEDKYPIGDMKFTLKSWYFDETNGGSGKGSICGEMCRNDNKCNSWMWRNSGDTCYLSVDKELKLKTDGCCRDHHPSMFGISSCPNIIHTPIILPTPINPINYCCINHHLKPTSPLEISNYDCSVLQPFGKERCDKVYGGNICRWASGKLCISPKCMRFPKYELHYKKFIDVGHCRGSCSEDKQSCNPSSYIMNQYGTNKIKIIKECECSNCGTDKSFNIIKIPSNKCKGDCNTNQKNRICRAGVDDNFGNGNGIEVSNPSLALVSGMLSGCSAGIQSGFDIFADNKCFGHTFMDCFSQGECPLRTANLKICMRAANVYLTHTDSLVLGINGGGVWGMGLPLLNGGSWNRNEQMCLDLDLGNLPGLGANILLDIQMAGHLDVMVQDDTAVDFLELTIKYENCKKCIPKYSTMSHLYSGGKVKDYKQTKECDCVNIGMCSKSDHFITYYQGTLFETTLNIGQCLGRCNNNLRCTPKRINKWIKTPEGQRRISIIQKCSCGKLTWNPHGLYNIKKT